MKTLTLNIPATGLFLKIAAGGPDTQIVIVAPDKVRISELPVERTASAASESGSERQVERPVQIVQTDNGFPPRQLTKQAIVQILREHGGSVKIRDQATGWNIYDEIAARLGVSMESRRRLTAGTGEPAWRPEVGFARKDLEQTGMLQPTAQSGWGVWALKREEQ